MFPIEIKDLVIARLTDPEIPCFSHLATIGLDGTPQVRTVTLKYDPESQRMFFATHMDSAKWSELALRPEIACNYHALQHLYDFRFTGAVELIPADDTRYTYLFARVWS